MVRWTRALAIVVALAGFTAACGGATTAPTTVSSLSVTGTAPSLSAGGSSLRLAHKAKATATMLDGTTQDVTSQAIWSSSNTADATVAAGVVTAVAPGAVSIVATYQNITASDQIIIGS